MQPHRAPLYEIMTAYHAQNYARFHVPGHKGGKGLEPAGKDFFSQMMTIDWTEIPGLDDLHQPTGPIKEAQQLAAACFGAEETFFLVNGSTVGNLAMIWAVCARNDLLIVQRNVHKSVIHGLMLAGVQAVFLPDRWDQDAQLAAGVEREVIIRAMEMYPSAKGVFLTNPNYYGMGIALNDIANDVHAKGMVLMIDEAHGAHHGFHPEVPASAISCGADAVVQSTHKMLTALTMGAMLHLQGDRIDRSLIRQALAMFQSSSPSYPIMASLDLSRRSMHTNGRELLERGLTIVSKLREKLSSDQRLEPLVALKQPLPGSAYYTLDPFKLAIRDRTGTFSGYMIKEMLEKAGCYAEMADPNYVLLQFSFATDTADTDRLYQALVEISKEIMLRGTTGLRFPDRFPDRFSDIPMLTEISSPIRMGFPQRNTNKNDSDMEWNLIEDSIGCYAAEMVTPYPPGIPILYPNEMISPVTVQYLIQLAESGAYCQGIEDGKLKVLKKK